MHSKIKTTLIAFIAMAITIFVIVPFFTKFIFDVSASKMLGTKVVIGSLSIDIFKHEVDIKDVKIYHPPGFEKGIMATIPLMEVNFRPVPFSGSKVRINSLSLEIPQLVVIRNQKGILNVDELKFKDYKLYVNIGEVIFSAGSVIYIDYTTGPKPRIQGYQVNIYERRYTDIPSAENVISKVLGDILARTAIKGAVVYGAATVAGISLAGPIAIPVGAGMILTEEDSAGVVFHKRYNEVYGAALEAINSMGELTHDNKNTGIIKGTVNGASVAVSINETEKNSTEVIVSARKWFIPNRQTAAGVLYKISTRLK